MASKKGNQDISERYARALFELAKGAGGLDAVLKDVLSLSSMLSSSEDLRRLVLGGAFGVADQKKGLMALADKASFSPITKKFLGIVCDNRRLPAIEGILAAVLFDIAREKGEVTVDVIAAAAFDKGQEDKLRQILQKALGLTVHLHVIQDPSILGGLVVQIGSRRIDASVRGKLDRLARALKNPHSSQHKTKMREVA